MHVPTYQFQEGEQDLWIKHIIMLEKIAKCVDIHVPSQLCWLCRLCLDGSPQFNKKKWKSYRSSKAALLRKFKEKVCTGVEPGKTAVWHFVTLLLPTKGHLWNDLQKFHSDDVLLPWTGLCFWMDENLLQPFRSTWPRSCSDISSVCHLWGNRWWRVTVLNEIELPLKWSYIIHVNSIELDPHQSQCSSEYLQLYGWPKNYLLWLEVDLDWHR